MECRKAAEPAWVNPPGDAELQAAGRKHDGDVRVPLAANHIRAGEVRQLRYGAEN